MCVGQSHDSVVVPVGLFCTNLARVRELRYILLSKLGSLRFFSVFAYKNSIFAEISGRMLNSVRHLFS